MPIFKTRPPYDPELEAVLAAVAAQLPESVTPDVIPLLRQFNPPPPSEELLKSQGLTHREVTVTGYQGTDIIVSVFARDDHTTAGPGVFHIHGGGMMAGNRFTTIEAMLEWVKKFDAVCLSGEYRIAPEFPDPFPVEDCYAALVWTVEHANELGIDPARILIAGASAGGGLSAGTALLARDRKGPALLAQVLLCPMLDDRNETVSSYQVDGERGVYDRTANFTGWGALLGSRRGTDDVTIYAAPARATDLSGLPPAFIDVGSAEVFRDEAVAYASQIWADGGIAELHVWPGGYHGFDVWAPDAVLSQAAVAAREAWAARVLHT
jgi:acetyl esterase/lipase